MSSQSLLDTQTPVTFSLTPSIQCKQSPLQSIWGRLYSRITTLDSYGMSFLYDPSIMKPNCNNQSFCVPLLHVRKASRKDYFIEKAFLDLSRSCFIFGRDRNSDAVVSSDTLSENCYCNISKTHFVITKKQDGLILITDRSKNGTFLNGKLIGKDLSNILQNDDEISVSLTNLKVFSFKIIESTENTYLPVELRHQYEISKELGKGACGEVRLMFDKYNCKPYAVKKIVKAQNTKDNKLNHPTKIKNEVKILQKLNHPFVVSTKDIVETENAVFIVLEYLEGGELNSFISKGLSERECKYLFYQMVLSLQYLHNQGIIHRDLKPENVLLKHNNCKSLLKITDFGLSKIVNEATAIKTVCGTLTYVAPEILDRSRTGSYGQMADIWSLGVILYYMLSKQLPFNSSERPDLIRKILHGKMNFLNIIWLQISSDAKDLLKRMLTKSPGERITLEQIIAHPWLADDSELVEDVQDLLASENETAWVSSSFECNLTRKKIKLSEDL